MGGEIESLGCRVMGNGGRVYGRKGGRLRIRVGGCVRLCVG